MNYRTCKRCGKKGVYSKYAKINGNKKKITERCKYCGRTQPYGI